MDAYNIDLWSQRPKHTSDGRLAQSVERWSNKPLVKGSSPLVTIFFHLQPYYASQFFLIPGIDNAGRSKPLQDVTSNMASV
jgi:hypothetical protein